MANIKDFRDFDAFKASRAFVREIGFLVRSTSLRRSRNLVDQMGRASISVLSNFAEGAERDGNAEFIQFLTICKGSIGELRAQLIYCLDIELIDRDKYDTVDEMAASAGRLVGGLARYLKTSGGLGPKIRESSPTNQEEETGQTQESVGRSRLNPQLVTRNP
jgi:four helix bundle protein